MFDKLKKIFARVALLALVLQMAVVMAPAGAHAANATNIATTYSSPAMSVGLDTSFVNTVKLQGSAYNDAAYNQAYSVVVLTRTDSPLTQVTASDVDVSLGGVAGIVDSNPTHLATLTSGNANALVLGWSPFTLMPDTFTAGVTNDFNAKIKTAGTYKFQNEVIYESVAPLGIINATPSDNGNVITADVTPPKVTTVVTPGIVNSLSKTIKVDFTSNEDMVLGNTFTYKQDGVNYIPANPSLVQPDDVNYVLTHSIEIPANFFEHATSSLEIDFTAKDMFGNTTPISSVLIPVDVTAPDSVTNLVASVNADGSVTLSWVNPTTSYNGLYVYRDGEAGALATLPVGTTSYTDTSVVRGQTYSYTVDTYDEAGNLGSIAPVQITVPAEQVAAAVSDSTDLSTSPSAVSEGTVTPATTTTTKNDDTNKNEDGLPSWAIVLLVILAAVGGYLIYNQKPVTTPVVPVASKKKETAAPKKVAPKKKPTNTKKK